MNKLTKIVKNNKIYALNNIIESSIFSIVSLIVISGIKIIDPRYTNWLSVGDGTAEISWEFFRKQPLFQFPLGLNPNYGLEISNTFALDGQISLLSLLFHPISNLLPERFQYIGFFIFFTFALNYFFAKRIFIFLNFTRYQSIVSSILLASSPVILNRLIENTHYSLISGWMIFAALLLMLETNFSLIPWVSLYAYSVLTHLYYLPFLVIMYLVLFAVTPLKKTNRIKSAINFGLLLMITGFLMFTLGYFYGGGSSKDVGYGIFRSTLLSLIDSSGWSQILPDIGESYGSYEGFGFIGIPAILLLIISIFSYKKKSKVVAHVSFNSVWISAVLLFLFSLSNKIAIGKLELFSFGLPGFISIIPETFRSTGRFIWLIAFTFFVYYAYSVSLKYSEKTFSIILTLILFVGIIDYLPQLQSQRKVKFQISYISSLNNRAWHSISECYSKLRVYPPTVGVDNYYDFVQVAKQQNLGINTGRFGRVNQDAIRLAYDQMHQEFESGIYRNDSFYVFTNAEFIIPEFVNYQTNLAIHTLNEDSAHGELNGYTFIAPNLSNCRGGKDLKSISKGFGAPKNQIYRGESLSFGMNVDPSKYILIGFSALEDWGVWSIDESSKINLNTKDISNFNMINITAKDIATPANSFSILVNDVNIGNCRFSTDFSLCKLPFDFKSLQTGILRLTFHPKTVRSPKDLGISDDTRNLGFGLKNISFS